jgi:hypothetical protein
MDKRVCLIKVLGELMVSPQFSLLLPVSLSDVSIKLVFPIILSETNSRVFFALVRLILGVPSLMVVPISNSREKTLAFRESTLVRTLISVNSYVYLEITSFVEDSATERTNMLSYDSGLFSVDDISVLDFILYVASMDSFSDHVSGGERLILVVLDKSHFL